MTDIPTLKIISKFNLPMIISTGMCTVDEIKKTYDEIIRINKNLILMNCTSGILLNMKTSIWDLYQLCNKNLQRPMLVILTTHQP